MNRNIADYIIETLVANGVRNIYGYPGAAIIPLMDAIERNPATSWILMRNEQAASLAASAEGKLTGKLAVCMATSGPGTTNLLTGMIDAQYDRSPVLAITGIPPAWKFGHQEFQDFDPVTMFSSYLKKCTNCTHHDQIPTILRDTIGYVIQERMPANIAISPDIQSYKIKPDNERFCAQPCIVPLTLHNPPITSFDLVVPEIVELDEQIIVVGTRAKGCGPAIEELALKLGAPIITSIDAKGIINEMHPCSIGVYGIFGSPGVLITNKILASAQAVLAFGVDDIAPFVVQQNGIQIRQLFEFEPDFTSVSQRYYRSRTLVGPLDNIAQTISDRLPSVLKCNVLLHQAEKLKEKHFHSKEWTKGHEEPFVNPSAFLMQLNNYLDKDTVIGLDIGDNTVWCAQYLILQNYEKVLVSNRLGVMGFCLPALIAAKLNKNNAKVIGICGDGGIQMTIGELATAIQNHLSFILIIFNNGVLQRVIAQQHHCYGTYIYNPDFIALAHAYGAEGAAIKHNSEIKSVLDQAFAHQGSPFIIDVKCSPHKMASFSKWEDRFGSSLD